MNSMPPPPHKKILNAIWIAGVCIYRFIKYRILRININMRSGDAFRSGIRDLIADLPDNITMVEIGSYRGESAELFLASGKVSKIFCVDPWKPFYDSKDPAAFTDMRKVEADFDQRFASDPRVSKEKGVLEDFVARYPEMPQIDFVYIDGCHSEEATLSDLNTTLRHLRPKRAIAGHDYNQAWGGVVKAVNATLGKPDKVYSDSSWIKFLA